MTSYILTGNYEHEGNLVGLSGTVDINENGGMQGSIDSKCVDGEFKTDGKSLKLFFLRYDVVDNFPDLSSFQYFKLIKNSNKDAEGTYTGIMIQKPTNISETEENTIIIKPKRDLQKGLKAEITLKREN